MKKDGNNKVFGSITGSREKKSKLTSCLARWRCSLFIRESRRIRHYLWYLWAALLLFQFTETDTWGNVMSLRRVISIYLILLTLRPPILLARSQSTVYSVFVGWQTRLTRSLLLLIYLYIYPFSPRCPIIIIIISHGLERGLHFSTHLNLWLWGGYNDYHDNNMTQIYHHVKFRCK